MLWNTFGSQLFTILSLRSFGYDLQKWFQFENQAHTNHLNLRF